ncbi:hamartin-like isoform X2 [Tubulanus polymorphus]|uniref:hamartin-like isoform X2 n=1 Tax=Tubulanus polymorphus TaxID=672921 RepID=UPI003DA2F65C
MASSTSSAQHARANHLCSLLDTNELRVSENIKEVIHEDLNETREPLLLNAIFDYYIASNSEKSVEILGGIREPHDKHLFDKCNEYMKLNQTKLPTLNLLGYIVRKQPSWLHKIVNHTLFTTIIKCLKTDTDVPILMSAALIVTTLLPVIPVAVGSYLNDIFLVFGRLADFATMKPGNIPDIFLLHLQVSVYALFHRLYGMYPCNFLAFLRAYYNKKERMLTFNATIKPMLERVRMHPLLVTASKDQEVSTSRWKHMEIHDIIIECAKMSLDVIEGTNEQNGQLTLLNSYREHFLSDKPANVRTLLNQTAGLKASDLNSRGVDLSLVLSNSDMFSPSAACGLSTPPRRLSPVYGTTTNEIASAICSTSYQAVPHTTPVPTSDTPVDDSFNHSQCGSAAKQRTSLPSLQLKTTPSPSTEVPPSPVKREFTSQPPVRAIRMQVKKAELNSPTKAPRDSANRNGDVGQISGRLPLHQQQHHDSLGLSGLDDRFNVDLPRSTGRDEWAIVRKESLESNRKESVDAAAQNRRDSSDARDLRMEVHERRNSSPPVRRDSAENQLLAVPHARNGVKFDLSQDKSPNMDMLPLVIEKLSERGSDDKHHCDNEMDKEVCDITKNNSSSIEDCCNQLTAQSVAPYIKRYNRQRFNSMNYDAMFAAQEPVKRTVSCPNLSPAQFTSESSSETVVSDSGGGGAQQTDNASSPPSVGKNQNNVKRMLSNSPCVDHQQTRPRLPYEDMFPFALPYTPIIQCQRCLDRAYTTPDYTKLVFSGLPQPMMTIGATPKVLGSEIPLFTQLSPPELLDRHLHLGGLPPADELNVLYNQVQLLHMQLMFERHKREQHAQRNRRQLGKIVEATALQEQNKAMKDQICLQENEIHSLNIALKLQQEETRRLKESKMKTELELDKRLKEVEQESEELKYRNKELKSQVLAQREDYNKLLKTLQDSKSQLFKVAHKIMAMKSTINRTHLLQATVERLNKELLMMGELQKKYQEKLAHYATASSGDEMLHLLLQAHKAEIADLNCKLSQKCVEIEASKAKLMEFEDIVHTKDENNMKMKRMQEHTKYLHLAEIEALNNKYHTLLKSNRQLETHIMQLRDRISHMESSKDDGSMKSLSNSARSSPSPDKMDIRRGSGPLELCAHGSSSGRVLTYSDNTQTDTPPIDVTANHNNNQHTETNGGHDDEPPGFEGDVCNGISSRRSSDSDLPSSYPGLSKLHRHVEKDYSCSEGHDRSINYEDVIKPFVLSYDTIAGGGKQSTNANADARGSGEDTHGGGGVIDEDYACEEAAEWQETRTSRSSTLMDSGIDS